MTEKKEMTLAQWKKRSNKLKTEYTSIDAIIDDSDKAFGEYYGTFFLASRNIFLVRPIDYKDRGSLHLSRDTVMYRRKDKKWFRIDTEKLISELIDHLAKHVTIEKLLKDVLEDSSPDTLEELFDRVIKNKGSVREEEGCYKLMIGGKRGQPFELMLRN